MVGVKGKSGRKRKVDYEMVRRYRFGDGSEGVPEHSIPETARMFGIGERLVRYICDPERMKRDREAEATAQGA